ncbi:hypothetical protein MMC13_008489 [Lambiella insularis]|nr:hypothetical protein [Lambiella insularis]
MDTKELVVMIDQLDGNIDDLQDALRPLFKGALSEAAQKLPLLDKAKLYVLATYAIESILFSVLRLNGTDAKGHPVFRELTRVKQYFEKIIAVEVGEQKKGNIVTLDRPAAARFIKHALARNGQFDRNQAQQRGRLNGLPQSPSTQSAQKRRIQEVEEIDLLTDGTSDPASKLIAQKVSQSEVDTTKPHSSSFDY